MPGRTGGKRKTKSTDHDSEQIIVHPRGKKTSASAVTLAKRKAYGEPASMPQDLKPMLATLVDEAFTDKEWQFELKLDGYRALAYLNEGSVDLRSRNNNSFNRKFAEIYRALSEWEVNAVVDGEVVVLDDDGVPDFNSIQHWEKKHTGQIVYYVFDILWFEGKDVTRQPLTERRDILKQIMPESGIIRYSDHIDESGEGFFKLAKESDLEGIIAKKKDSLYFPDSRSKTWLKIKVEERHEALICGFTRKTSSDRAFSSLILGRKRRGKLECIGQVGTGFNSASMKDLMKKMEPLIIKSNPFQSMPVLTGKPTWLEPELVCEVKYTELTNEGVMRHASFQGLRTDKTPAQFNDAPAEQVETILHQEHSSTEISKDQDSQVLDVNGHSLKLSNLKKIYWPKEKYTKGDMLRYYLDIASFMLPYMKDRPQSLNRFPGGIEGESFYHKNMTGKLEPWLKTFRRYSDSDGNSKDFLVCSDTASLIYMANLGCIEMNPWHSRTSKPLNPDWCVIDLDPGEISFNKVIETALVVKKILDSVGVDSFPKTSGSTGIHIYIPLGAKYDYDQSRQLAELVANLVHDELPTFTSLIRNPEKRKDKIYIDYLQNRPIQTICAPYSVRPKPGATVSAPLHWDEVRKGLKISQFNMFNMMQRVKTEGDLFKGVLSKGINLEKLLKSLISFV